MYSLPKRNSSLRRMILSRSPRMVKSRRAESGSIDNKLSFFGGDLLRISGVEGGRFQYLCVFIVCIVSTQEEL